MTRKKLHCAALGLLTCCMMLGSSVAIAQNDALVLQLRAADYDDATGIWTDSSEEGNDFLQPNPGALVRPTKVAGQTPNGNSVVRFGEQDWMFLDAVTIEDWIYPADRTTDPTSGVTFFAYVKPEDRSASTDAPDGRYLISGNAGSPSLLFKKDGRQRVAQQNTANLGEALEVSHEYGCYSAAFDRTGGVMRLNGEFNGDLGSTDVIQPNVTRAWGPVFNLGFSAFPNAAFLGDVAEIRIYDRKLTLAEIEAVEAELCAAYEEAPNAAPTANAGDDQSIHAGDIVSLDGTGSDDDNTEPALLSYAWTITSSPMDSTAVLVDSDTVAPSFTADLTGDYVIELVVTDEGGLASTDSVTISSNNQAPTANVTTTDTLAFVGDAVTLDGSGSLDPDGDDITYSWTITAAPEGSSAVLVFGADPAKPTLTPDLEGVYEVSLEVADFLGPNAVLATVDFTATTAESFAESLILDACDIVSGLNGGQVTSKGNKNAFCKHLANAVKDLQGGETADAIHKLEKAISRTDGCPLRGDPDGNGKGRDWITDCDAQHDIYDALKLAVETLEP